MNNIFDSFIIGMLLGDGYLNKTAKATFNSRFIVAVKIENKDFIDFAKSVLESHGFRCNVSKSATFDKRTRKIYHSVRLQSNASRYFTELRKKWYPRGIKIVPEDLELSPLSTAIWFMGDGYSRWIKGNAKVQVKFCTDGFSKKDVKLLLDKLMGIGINGHIFKVRNNRFNIGVMRSHEVKKLMNMIEPHIIESFSYKIKHPIALTQSEAAIQRIKKYGHVWSGRTHTKETKMKIGITSKIKIQTMERDVKGRLLCKK